ncbi:ATP synthase regulation protein NCA2-domain-containing protein [Fimicolochytrium jonesii]|uniref:ATP synthase regulation protein NCA2-domain-containing protein n=1 Tax=Fimicolochytrium jonesii TaxID=1396493 RepID=UPI0022FF007D|nr:ATP synthase regulation protein NCA2-domain-containing protein [Fimicolochytrium jonesii]KAI8825635.1 ATP synthase regulation protein NCA2-domain-containing protein [Fimicolochytrium jonesii]
MAFVSERLEAQLRALNGVFHLDADHDDLSDAFRTLFGSAGAEVAASVEYAVDSTRGVEETQEAWPEPIRLLWHALLSQPLVPTVGRHADAGDQGEDGLPTLQQIERLFSQVHKGVYGRELRRDSGGKSGLTGESAVLPQGHYPLAELAFLSKIAAVLQATLLQRLLVSSTRWPPDIAYWQDQQMSTSKTIYYILSMLPQQISRYLHLLYEYTRATTHSSIRPQFLLFSDRLNAKLRRNFFERAALLPTTLTTTAFLGLPGRLLALTRRPLLLDLARREIRFKAEKLERIRETQAACLGLLAEEDFSNEQRLNILTKSLAGGLSREQAMLEAAERIQAELSRSLLLMEAIVYRMHAMADNLSSDGELALADVSDLRARVADISTIPIPQLYRRTTAVISAIQTLDSVFDRLRRTYGRPSHATRYWLPTVVISVAAYVGGKTLAVRWDDVVAWATDARETAKSFCVEWIAKPLDNIYKTVRHKEARLAISSGDSLNADLQSLEKMVVEYARDHGILDPSEIQRVADQAQKGDLSVVLQAYAEEIKSPIKNAISGDLIRALLIQVQKAKVDGELAIDALDKLLRSNELNFAFLAVTPSLFLTWLLFSKLGTLLGAGKEKKRRKTYEYIRASLRNVDRLLAQSIPPISFPPDSTHHTPTTPVPYKSHGLLLCELYLLRKYAPRVTRREGFRQRFVEDLRDLESGGSFTLVERREDGDGDEGGQEEEGRRREVQTNVAGKMLIVQRMWRTYPFVRGE